MSMGRPKTRRAFIGDDGGAVAVEFALLYLVFISLMLACVQFSLYFIAAMRMRTVLAETVAYASVFSNTKFFAETRDLAKVRQAICKDLVLANDCMANLKLEQMPLKSLPARYKPIAGTQFVEGDKGDVLVRRAQVPVVTFVPGIAPLTIQSSSIWLRR